MPSNFSQIYKKTSAVHKKLDNHTFLKRYSTDQFTLRDRHRHLSELVPIYEAIEEKMKETSFGQALQTNPDLRDLLTRSTQIKEDLTFLEKESKIIFKSYPLTQASVKYINSIRQMKNPQEILAHFYVRILGDFHGGPLTKEHVITLLKNRNFYREGEGVNFYTFADGESKKFHAWLETQTLAEESFEFAKQAFQTHIDIFDEIEKTRDTRSTLKTLSLFFTSTPVSESSPRTDLAKINHLSRITT